MGNKEPKIYTKRNLYSAVNTTVNFFRGELIKRSNGGFITTSESEIEVLAEEANKIADAY